mgnify:CR=1 FL=1
MREKFFSYLHNIELSEIVKIAEKSRVVEKDFETKTHEKIIHFDRGETDQNVPSEIVEDIKLALDFGKTKYPKSGGEPLFKNVLKEKVKSRNGIKNITVDDIIVTCGAQEAMCLAFELFTNRTGAGFSPIYSLVLENFVPYCNQRFIEVPLNEDFSINFILLEETLKNVDFFYLNTPHNPTGKVFSKNELTQILELCKKYNVFIISDEAYEDFIYDGKKHISIASLPESEDYYDIISIYTFSKSFAGTGLRVGYAVTKNKVAIKIMNGAQYTHTAGIPTFLQHGLLNSYKVDISKIVHEFQRRRDVLYNGLFNIEGVNIVKPEGAFYMYPDFSGIQKRFGNNDKKHVFKILLENGICTVPGTAFTKSGYFENNIRFSYSAADIDQIKVGIERINRLFNT